MKTSLFVLMSVLIVSLSSFLAAAEQSQWLENFEQAKKLAAEKKLPMLVLFTGSDWCPTCIFMEKEVFSKKEFLNFAGKNLILMKADFPENRKLPENIKKQNDELAMKYALKGDSILYPTITIFDSNGKFVQEVSNENIGKPVLEYIDVLRKIISKIKK